MTWKIQYGECVLLLQAYLEGDAAMEKTEKNDEIQQGYIQLLHQGSNFNCTDPGWRTDQGAVLKDVEIIWVHELKTINNFLLLKKNKLIKREGKHHPEMDGAYDLLKRTQNLSARLSIDKNSTG